MPKIAKLQILKLFGIQVALLFLFHSCDPGLKGQLEYADFLLDRSQFSDAIKLLDVLDLQYPDNIEVKGKLAAAHLANAVLSGDRTYLSLVADYFEETAPGKTEFQQFSEKSPSLNDEQVAELSLAKIIFDEQIPDDKKSKQIWIQLAFARLLEINAIGVIKTGALSPDEHCNADPTILKPDGVPDNYNSGALTPEDSATFNDDADKVGDNFVNAGLSGDIGIIKTINKIRDDLAASASLENYLNKQFGSGVPCPP